MKNFNYFDFYKLYSNIFMRVLRLSLLIGFAILIIIYSHDFILFRFFLVIYALFLINEIFIHFKINTCFPHILVIQDKAIFENSSLFKTRKIMISNSSSHYFSSLLKEPDVKFLIDRLGMNPEKIEIERKVLLEKSLEVCQKVGGKYVTSADVITAYLLLTEEKTKLLLGQELTENDLLEILMWARERFKLDIRKTHRMHFSGYGVFDFFVYGWDTLVKEYSDDISLSVIGKYEAPIVGREKEFKEMVTILSKSTNNNVLIIGEPGLGRAALVRKLALEAYRDIHFPLARIKVFELLVDRLLSGVQSQGEIEERLSLLLAELEHSGNIVLFIQNIENIFGAGGFNFDMSGILFQYLKSGRVQIIGATSPSLNKMVIEKHASISNMFERIKLEEPDRASLFKMIVAHVDIIEYEYRVIVSYKAIHESVELSSNYMPDFFLPGKAVNLLESAAAKVRMNGENKVSRENVTQIIQEKTNILLEKPSDEEKKTLLSLEENLHKRVIGQSEAVDAVAKAIRRLRSGFSQHKRPISVFLFLGPTGVGKTETAKALASLYFGDENAMIRLDMSEYQTQFEVEKLLGGTPGGEEMMNSLPEAIRTHPFSLLLLDEFEKAHPNILDIFLQIFEDGRLTDNQGRTVSFKNTIIIATSNAGSEAIRQMVKQGINSDMMKSTLIEGLLTSGQFKPELLNRFDDVIVFKPLTHQEAGQIAQLLLVDSLKTLEDDQIYLTFSNAVIEKIVNESYDEEAGARNMRRYIGSTIEDFISRLILEDKLARGTHAEIATDVNGNYILQ